MKTSIVILTRNNLTYTKLCLESIRCYTQEGSYELIIVDNGSTDGTVEWLQEQLDLHVIYNEENLGFPKGCNQGMAAATGDYMLLLNNDTIVTVNWLDQLLNCLRSDERIGAVGPVTNAAAYHTAISVPYRTLEELGQFAGEYNKADPTKWEERIKLIGYCILMKREVIEKVGWLDERFSPGNYEDEDYCLRIRLAGYKLMLCKDTFIQHFGSASFNENPSFFSSVLQENENKFAEKWKFNPVYSTHIRYDLLSLIDRMKDDSLRILEVGCGCGATLLQLKNLYPHAEMYGVELNEHSASVASLVAQVESQNIETMDLRYPKQFFDYVIFGDVLEHLYDPWKVLKDIALYLKEDGKVLASIPNAMHFSLIRDLLNGYWTYTDRGLLDRTHIRFFTFYEICKMFKETGYDNLNYSRVTIGRTEQNEAFMTELCKWSHESLWDQYETYQYLFQASKHAPAGKDSEPRVRQKLKFLLRFQMDMTSS
ncbi:bifunctional glycosyltransferase family 2 protein/class I SAM-dependent methyltransferase [Paenibacillus sp. GP183]|uniref:bifunctional glycosyltransferase family 2 protein/class I SAM-dependent methyltransferase n=1 Tax=Paenibacillus sp. GP183 TaxID=1882751 RepID=UPI0008948A6E|nr:bifunctional glycosyltransferase family 2 protein/class I SAM-dependent methyltransferase [Paenibacillus sp. GP183]SEC70790.1 Glycosyltransferase, GT2 family [Paenibacillus sp. GP183]